jgi:hypothetical protein
MGKKIENIKKILKELQIQSVIHGIRPSCFINIDPSDLINISTMCLENNLTILPILIFGKSNFSFINTFPKFDKKKEFQYMVFIGEKNDALSFKTQIH